RRGAPRNLALLPRESVDPQRYRDSAPRPAGRHPRRRRLLTLRLEVVVVSHGQPELLRACLRSLEEHPPSCEMRVSVVDSGSPAEVPDMVEREFPWARLIREDNIGFSAANNL